MSGSDGNRGYLVQTLIALLDSLRSNDWDRVTIEPSHESEIVDIIWESGNYRIAKQVKSSINQIKLPDAKRWAKQLEGKSDADELELVLVGSPSDGVIKVGQIGKVRVPHPKNLDLEGLISEASHLLDTFLYSIGFSSTSPDQTRLIAKGLVTELSILASQSKSLSRAKLIKTLTGWIQADSPERITSLHKSVLSRFPRSVRPGFGSKLIGRENEARWLRETEGDKLIIGQPGIGKTFLLCDYVREGPSFFLRSDDEDKIEKAIGVVSPNTIVIEDAHIHTETVDILRRLRVESQLSYTIVADCWPGSRDLMIEKLGVRAAGCLELQPVSDQEIVDIVHEFGIRPSNSFLHMVVRQARGCPGRATMLVETCLGGTHEDYDDFWNGETLAGWVRTRFTNLIGKEAIQVLACFAIGGSKGVATELVARALQFPRAQVSEIVSELSLGGVVVDLSSGRIAVVPSSIRAILVRDHFFRIAGIPIDEFLSDEFAFSNVVATIVEAYTFGADFPVEDLRTLVKKSDDLESWAALTHSSTENARFVIEERQDLIPSLAGDFLQTIPDLAIPALLRLADGDFRPLHSNTDHPLRQLGNWVKSGYPSREALHRRKAVFNTFCTIGSQSIDLALRLLPIFVSPNYENMEQNPGNRRQYALCDNCVSVEDLQGIAKFWPETLEVLKYTSFDNWESILEAAGEWLWPHFSGGAQISDEQRKVIGSSASYILLQLVQLAADRPGVLRKLAQIAEVHETELSYTIPPCYNALFPLEPSYDGDHEKHQSEFASLVTKSHEQGEVWAEANPKEVISEISHWIEEAKFGGRAWPDLCSACCDAISAKVDSQLTWVRAILELDARQDLLTPFLRRAIDANEQGWEEILIECLASDRCLSTAMELALTHPRCTNNLVNRAISKAPKARETLRTTVMLRRLDDSVISDLLKAEDSRVVRDTLEGIWHKMKKAPREASWYSEWRTAVVEHLDDDYCLRGALNDDPLLRDEWLACLASSISDRRRFKLDVIKTVAYQMSDEQRTELLDKVKLDAPHATKLIIALIGTSLQRYEKLLKKQELKKFWAVPLQRKPDKTWNAFALKALEYGIHVQTIVDQTRVVLSKPVPEKYHYEIEAWTSCFETVDPPLRRVVEVGLEEARREVEDWERRERERNL